MLPSYRNQSINLLCTSIDWFLYEGNTGTRWVNLKKKSNLELLKSCKVVKYFVHDCSRWQTFEVRQSNNMIIWIQVRKCCYNIVVIHQLKIYAKFSILRRFIFNIEKQGNRFKVNIAILRPYSTSNHVHIHEQSLNIEILQLQKPLGLRYLQ